MATININDKVYIFEQSWQKKIISKKEDNIFYTDDNKFLWKDDEWYKAILSTEEFFFTQKQVEQLYKYYQGNKSSKGLEVGEHLYFWDNDDWKYVTISKIDGNNIFVNESQNSIWNDYYEEFYKLFEFYFTQQQIDQLIELSKN